MYRDQLFYASGVRVHGDIDALLTRSDYQG